MENVLFISSGVLGVLFIFSLIVNLFLARMLKTEKNKGLKKYYTDQLTDLYNRHYLNDIMLKLYKSIARNNQKRRDEKTSFSIIVADIDHFKRYNDQFGHLEGDYCLKIISRCFKDNIARETDAAIRYGGEEFLVVLPDCDNEGALIIAKKIKSSVDGLKLKNPSHDDENSLLTVSMGLATVFPDNKMKIEDVIKQADDMLYKAKKGGRNRIAR